MKKVLVVGATGQFGQRLVQNLTRVDGICLALASRDLKRAEVLAATIPGSEAVAMDRNAPERALARVRPWAVIDASGPFQGQDHSFVKAVLAAGAHYVDIADAKDFILGIGSLDALARQQGLVALTGASSSPALSCAVVADITRGWKRIDTVDIDILPDGRQSAGRAVVEAILSMAGRPCSQFRFGRLREVIGLRQARQVAVPGLGRRNVAAVDLAEPVVLQRKFNVQSRVRFFAGPEACVEFWGLLVLAWMRARRLLPDLRYFAGALCSVRHVTRLFTSDNGGMVVSVAGLDAKGEWCLTKWILTARHGMGPNVPGLAAVAAIRQLLKGKIPPGARAAIDLPLEAIASEFVPHHIVTSKTVEGTENFFAQVMGPQFDDLAPAIHKLHQPTAPPVWAGEARVDRGKNPIARLVGWWLGLPAAAASVPVRVTIERETSGDEVWYRDFGGKMFKSVFSRGLNGGAWERFGTMRFRIGLTWDGQSLHYPITKGTWLGMPMPRFLLPSSVSREFVDDKGRFCFDVRLGLPIFGFLVHYRGWLKPVTLQ